METAKAAEKPIIGQIGYAYEFAGFSQLNMRLDYAVGGTNITQQIKTDFKSLEKLLDSAFSGCKKTPTIEINNQGVTELSAGYKYMLFEKNTSFNMLMGIPCSASYNITVAEFGTAATIKFYFKFAFGQEKNIFTVYDELLATHCISNNAKAVADQITYLRQSGKEITPESLLSGNTAPLLIASKAKR